ncbi:multiple epidermal growth factor-like domains protein 10 [Ostrea edulis]|uniref:multiple epidermal growth factor-like domains protein 10 n=1 Tax=Ostrea edulis TaxID=37623 RepID=UPI0024AF3EE4|nr:multiple epidermal growth factor-like domains protein 10 [Ostrea edulis]
MFSLLIVFRIFNNSDNNALYNRMKCVLSIDFVLCSCHIFLCFLSLHVRSSISKICNGLNEAKCCYGYVWSETQNKCTRCVDGFYGRNCTFPCQYPTFGLKCCSTCNCSREDCHHVYGCSQSEAAPKPINISHTDGIHTEEKEVTESAPKPTNTPLMGETEEKRDASESNSVSLVSDCKVGYIGENCDSPCRYPNYGVDCQLICNCNESYCNHKHGCRGKGMPIRGRIP